MSWLLGIDVPGAMGSSGIDIGVAIMLPDENWVTTEAHSVQLS